MEHTTSEYEFKSPKLDKGQLYVKIYHAVTRKLLACSFPPNNERKLHITTTELNLISGGANDYGPCFTRPFPHDQMREDVNREQPWNKFNIHGANIDDSPKLRRYRRWVNASQVLIGLDHSMRYIFDDDMPEKIFDDGNHLGSVYASQNQWAILGWTNAKDLSQPHITAFVVDAQPHHLGRLRSGEVSLAYGLIAKRRIEDGYNDHRYIPITFVSASDFQVRILQIWHDKQNPEALQVRSSRIMDFTDGIQSNLDDWVTILCWMAGEPIGDTKHGTEVVRVSQSGA